MSVAGPRAPARRLSRAQRLVWLLEHVLDRLPGRDVIGGADPQHAVALVGLLGAASERPSRPATLPAPAPSHSATGSADALLSPLVSASSTRLALGHGLLAQGDIGDDGMRGVPLPEATTATL